jgi:integrase
MEGAGDEAGQRHVRYVVRFMAETTRDPLGVDGDGILAYIAGKAPRGSERAKSRAALGAYLAWAGPPPPTAPPPLTWAECYQRWQAFLGVNEFSPRTLSEYGQWIQQVVAETIIDPNFLTEGDIVAYLQGRMARGTSKKSYLAALRSYLRWAEGEGLVPYDPTRRLKFSREKYKPAPNLTDEELVRLVVAAAAWNPRWAWAILFMFGTGARLTSAASVRREDVYADGGGLRVYFRSAKNDDPYSVPLEEPALTAVRRLLAGDGLVRSGQGGQRSQAIENPENPADDALLIGVKPGRLREWIEISSRRAGVHVWPHLLRHAYATRLARVADPRTWMELMNHKDLRQFRRYVAPDDTLSRRALRLAFSPLALPAE